MAKKNLLDNKAKYLIGSSLFCDVAIPLALPQLLTYQIPESLVDEVNVGCRVIVPLGQNKRYSAIVFAIHSTKPEDFTPKQVELSLDPKPILLPIHLNFWKWLANYYLCSLGEIFTAALPSALKLSSETLFTLNQDFTGELGNLGDNEILILDLLTEKQQLSIPDIQKLLGKKQIIHEINTLLEANAIAVFENLPDKFKPKLKTYLKLNEVYAKNETAFNALFESLEKKAPKQVEVLLMFIKMSDYFSQNPKEVEKVKLQKAGNYSDSVVKSLLDKAVFLAYEKEIGRLTAFEGEKGELPRLSEAQNLALKEIYKGTSANKPVLLKGITGSGKTELYAHLMQRYIKEGKQVLMIVPEITLTTQLITRIRKYFGDTAVVYHSGFSDQHRAEVWKKVLTPENNKVRVVVSTRSGIFLPFKALGAIIVDEEHDSSLKQSDVAPRYHARDAAVYLAHQLKIPIVLGSATPAIETYYNTTTNKYTLVELNERFGEASLPRVEFINLKNALYKKQIKGHFSDVLIEQINDRLYKGEQVILFQNRRGYAPVLTCKTCGYVAECKSCDISLTYHKFAHKLICHYCGYREEVPAKCPSCGSIDFEHKGAGTEQLEEELQQIFPKARIQRMDFDSTRGKYAVQDIIEKFTDREVDILLGTQMVTKGLDFDNVTLVGVITADSLFSLANFRAQEKGFQMLSQISGRAGRKEKLGSVFIQTYKPERAVLNFVKAHDYTEFFKYELAERKQFLYPPFVRCILITLKHVKNEVTQKAAEALAAKLRVSYTNFIYGPTIPEVSRIKNFYLRQILIKLPNTANQHEIKQQILSLTELLKSSRGYSALRINIDVDFQ
ncbi:MAG: replication restart helicase PriA [Luteibaculaceae bacterium]